MEPPGLSLLHPEGLDIVHEADGEDELDDADEALQIEEQIDKGLSQAFNDLDSNFGDEDEDEEEDGETLRQGQNGGFNLGSNALSTPPMREFHKLIPEKSPMQSTPIYGEGQYIKAGDANEDLKILYQARGNEINRLNEEIQSLSRSKDSEHRLHKHQINILEADKNNLMTNVEQLNELLRGSSEENKALREEINSIKAEKERDNNRVRETSDKLENSEYMIRNLQTQLQQLQRSDALLKARQQHDAIVRSLKERHETEVYNLQEEVDKLYSQVRRQEAEVSDLRSKLIQKDLVEPSREMEERLREKDLRIDQLVKKLKEKEKEHTHALEERSKVITKLNARLDENQKRVSELISEKISTKQLENDIKIAEITLKSLQKENEELRINTNAIELKAQHFESLARCRPDQEAADSEIDAALKKSMNDIIHRDKEIASLKQKLASLESRSIQSEVASLEGVSDGFTEKVKSLTEELSRMTNKYLTLKRKVKAYQDHCQRKEKHFQNEMKRMEDEYKSTLLTLKSKMEAAYNTKEQEIEIELMEMKDHFYAELEKITSLDKKQKGWNDYHSISPDEFLNGISECSSASKKENTAPASRLEEVDRFFARAQEDAKNKIASLQSLPRPFSTLNNNNNGHNI